MGDYGHQYGIRASFVEIRRRPSGLHMQERVHVKQLTWEQVLNAAAEASRLVAKLEAELASARNDLEEQTSAAIKLMPTGDMWQRHRGLEAYPFGVAPRLTIHVSKEVILHLFRCNPPVVVQARRMGLQIVQSVLTPHEFLTALGPNPVEAVSAALNSMNMHAPERAPHQSNQAVPHDLRDAREECPHCKRRFKGLRDHIRDKHTAHNSSSSNAQAVKGRHDKTATKGGLSGAGTGKATKTNQPDKKDRRIKKNDAAGAGPRVDSTSIPTQERWALEQASLKADREEERSNLIVRDIHGRFSTGEEPGTSHADE